MKEVIAFTDGSCLGNPGPGGWGIILRYANQDKEFSGGFRYTTNNRMELIAAIFALEQLKEPCVVRIYTDSKYLCDAVEKHWLSAWQKNNWRTAGKKCVKNQDLWKRLQLQLVRHKVTFSWIQGHSGHIENERCDVLARIEASKNTLPEDIGFIHDNEKSF